MYVLGNYLYNKYSILNILNNVLNGQGGEVRKKKWAKKQTVSDVGAWGIAGMAATGQGVVFLCSEEVRGFPERW